MYNYYFTSQVLIISDFFKFSANMDLFYIGVQVFALMICKISSILVRLISFPQLIHYIFLIFQLYFYIILKLYIYSLSRYFLDSHYFSKTIPGMVTKHYSKHKNYYLHGAYIAVMGKEK